MPIGIEFPVVQASTAMGSVFEELQIFKMSYHGNTFRNNFTTRLTKKLWKICQKEISEKNFKKSNRVFVLHFSTINKKVNRVLSKLSYLF